MSDVRSWWTEETEPWEKQADVLSEALGIQVLSYNSEITDAIVGVMKLARRPNPAYNTDIARKLDLAPNYVELIQYLICQNDHAEYGVSPRGIWLTDKGEKLLEQLLSFSLKDQE